VASLSFAAAFPLFQLALGLAGLSCLYYLAVLFASLKFVLHKEASTDFTPPVSILKPVRGIEEDFYANLASHCRQEYPCFEIIFGLGGPAGPEPDPSTDASNLAASATAKDPALWTIAQLQRDFPKTSIKTFVVPESRTPNSRGVNRKMNSLQRMLEAAAYDIVVIDDADIGVEPDYLRDLVQPLADERVGLVTCLYRGVPAGTLASLLEALGISGDFAGQVMLAQWLEGIKFALGATMATRKKQIAEIGGLARWSDYLADDYILGNRIAAAGYQVHLSRVVVETHLSHRSFSEVFRQQLRWARTIRFARPQGYLGLLLTFGVPFAVLAVILRPHSALGQGALALTLAVRWLAAWACGALVCRDGVIRNFFWLLPLRDLLAFGVWIASFFGSQVTWRGERFKLAPGGKISPA